MKAFRISHPDYADDLSGKGAWLHGGRWNQKGTWMLYAAETSSLAILELLGHIQGLTHQLPYIITQLDISGSSISGLDDFTHPMPSNWASDRNGMVLIQKIGEDWVKSKTTAVLKVPSVHSPFESNLLINPQHPELAITILEKRWYLHDYRLVEK